MADFTAKTGTSHTVANRLVKLATNINNIHFAQQQNKTSFGRNLCQMTIMDVVQHK